MKELERAREIKNQFKDEVLHGLLKDYINGIGLSKDESGNYCLEVRFMTRPNSDLPAEYKGMKINYKVIGKIKKIS